MSRKIVISIGHGKSATGAYDPGAVSKDKKYEEHKIAREIGRYAAEYLGCKLINYDGTLCLTQRIKKVNTLRPDFTAEIHLNAGRGTGTETFYYHGSPTGKRVADEICRQIAEAFGVKNRGAKVKLNSSGKDYFGFIRQTDPCAVLVETLFIDSTSDLKKIKTDSGMKACGQAIGKALEAQFADNIRIKAQKDIIVKAGAGADFATVSTLKKGAPALVTLTSYDSKWVKLKDGGWIAAGRNYAETKGENI